MALLHGDLGSRCLASDLEEEARECCSCGRALWRKRVEWDANDGRRRLGIHGRGHRDWMQSHSQPFLTFMVSQRPFHINASTRNDTVLCRLET